MLIELNKQMTKAAKDLHFEEAIRLRDEIEKNKKNCKRNRDLPRLKKSDKRRYSDYQRSISR